MSWSPGGTSGMCSSSTCSGYDSESACCANANSIKTGCYWNEHASGGECVELGSCGEMAKGKCSDAMDSSCPEAQSVCEALPGCQWNSCGGCQEVGMTCTCSSTGATPICTSDGDTSADEAGAALLGVLTG